MSRSYRYEPALLDQLVGSIRSFCALIDDQAALSLEELLESANTVLPLLYGDMNSFIRNREWTDDDNDLDQPYLTADERFSEVAPLRKHEELWPPLFRALTEKLGTFDVYKKVFDPYDPDYNKEVTSGTLADDLSDIYLDLKSYLKLYDLDTPEGREEAALEWELGYKHHWGRHLTSALTALHVAVNEIRDEH